MGRRSRRAQKLNAPDRGQALEAPAGEYTDAEGNVLRLRGSLTAATRRKYAEAIAGEGASTAATREDAWQRAAELLFERLAVSWTIAGAPIERQRELLMRYRAASPAERAWVRRALREHCAEHFPELQPP